MPDDTGPRTVRYAYRLRVGARAELTLNSEWNRCRWLWNEAVHQWRTYRKPTLCKLSKLLTEARSQNQWLREGAQNPQQQMLRTYAKSLTQSFTVKGRGRPKLKSRKKSDPSLEYTTNGFAIRDGRLCLAKCPPIPVVWSRGLPSKPTSVRVYRDNLGHWYASFVVRVEDELGAPTAAGIGVDWGVKTTAATTDPEYDLPHYQHRYRCSAEVAKAQRKMARRQRNGGKGPQSKGYKRAKLESAKIQKRAARQVKHDARVWANSVVNDHGLIAVEDFKPTFLAKSTMARKSADSAIGMTKRVLVEKAERSGRTCER